MLVVPGGKKLRVIDLFFFFSSNVTKPCAAHTNLVYDTNAQTSQLDRVSELSCEYSVESRRDHLC